MSLAATCPRGHTFSIPNRLAGKLARCPKCQTQFHLPGETPPDDRSSPGPPPLPSRRKSGAAAEPGAPPASSPVRAEEAPRSADADDSSNEEVENSLATSKRGYTPPREKLVTAYSFALALGILAFFSAVPLAFEILAFVRSDDGAVAPPRWAYVVAFAAAVKLVYAIYLAQLPDWSATWMTTMCCLLMASAYAMLFGALLWGDAASPAAAWLEIHPARLPKARAWTFSMAGLMSLLAYFGGRASLRWRREFARYTLASKS